MAHVIHMIIIYYMPYYNESIMEELFIKKKKTHHIGIYTKTY